MNTSTKIFKSKVTTQVSLVGMLLMLLSFFTISGTSAQNISELNQFLESQESVDSGIDSDYLYGSHSIVYVTYSDINFPQEGSPKEVNIMGGSLNRLTELGSALGSVEILLVKISTEADKSGSLSAAAIGQMSSLKVILVLSEVPISLSEVQSIVSSVTNPLIKILYIYSEPV